MFLSNELPDNPVIPVFQPPADLEPHVEPAEVEMPSVTACQDLLLNQTPSQDVDLNAQLIQSAGNYDKVQSVELGPLSPLNVI
jgi:hypothetical protein